MSANSKVLPKDVQDAIEKRIRQIGDSRAATMRRIVRNENFAVAWESLCSNRKARKGLSRKEFISTLYRACYEAAFLFQRQEMMTKGEARKIVEGLELLAKRENHLFLRPNSMSDPESFLFLLEKYRMYAQGIPTGARRVIGARSLAGRLCSVFTESLGTACHTAAAAVIRATFGGNCNAATVRVYLSGTRPKR
jgi:hypothetical protein